MRPMTRVEPKLGPEAFKTYAIVAPKQTHTRAATCREVECAAWQHGFATTVDLSTDLGQRQAAYLEAKSGRAFTTETAGTLRTYTFTAGQACFTAHRITLEREPLYVVKDGDYRGNPRGTRPATRRAEDWVDDFATHQQRIHDALERG
jgi:hypothetical protein